ncbi:lipocalin-like domain-containing protein [Arthrobacter sp. UYEF3]|uniref:lipocalin-like domain-containing protein n=1 Tax=Arthrobacter sp. UYEF3 TaxID=1756365 RepID=UPI003391E6BD
MRTFIEVPVDGSKPSYPMGEEVQGMIMSTPDGLMSTQLISSGRGTPGWRRRRSLGQRNSAPDAGGAAVTRETRLRLPAASQRAVRPAG